MGAESREAIVAEAEAFVIHVGRVREGRVYSSEVAAGVVAALMDPGSGIPASGVKAFLGTLAGAYEIGEDNGLDALAGAVERRLAEVAGLEKVRCVVSAGGTSFEVEAYDGDDEGDDSNEYQMVVGLLSVRAFAFLLNNVNKSVEHERLFRNTYPH